jgi:hypothetical protein
VVAVSYGCVPYLVSLPCNVHHFFFQRARLWKKWSPLADLIVTCGATVTVALAKMETAKVPLSAGAFKWLEGISTAEIEAVGQKLNPGTMRAYADAKILAAKFKADKKVHWGITNPNIPDCFVHPSRRNENEISKIKAVCPLGNFTCNVGKKLQEGENPSWEIVKKMKFWSSDEPLIQMQRDRLKKAVVAPAASASSAENIPGAGSPDDTCTTITFGDTNLKGLDNDHCAIVTVANSTTDVVPEKISARKYNTCVIYLPSGMFRLPVLLSLRIHFFTCRI